MTVSTSHSPVVAITGASSGIGAATVRRLVADGARVMMGARREDRLADLAEEIRQAGGEADYRVTDVTDRSQVHALITATVERFGRVDVVVANAGLMPLSPLAARKVDEWERMVDVNIKGVLYCIDAALPQFEEQGNGHFITLSSVAGHKVMPAGAVYSGTKYAVRAIAEGLRQESGATIRSTILSPGAIDTELPEHISDPGIAERARELYQAAISPQSVANAIGYAVSQPAEVDINEIVIRPTAQEL